MNTFASFMEEGSTFILERHGNHIVFTTFNGLVTIDAKIRRSKMTIMFQNMITSRFVNHKIENTSQRHPAVIICENLTTSLFKTFHVTNIPKLLSN